MQDHRREIIEKAFADRTYLAEAANAVESVVADLDQGKIRVVEPLADANPNCEIERPWQVNTWVKQAILLYFALHKPQVTTSGDVEYRDLLPTKHNLESQGIRVVPPGVARYGSFMEPGSILMTGYVNIGAYVGTGSMVDSWATVGSCAYIGRGVHLSGSVTIGGVLEPANARPVIIEDGAFIGAQATIVEGVHVGQEAVIAAGVVITSSTPILDVRGSEVKTLKGYVPSRAVVIPGVRQREFPAGTFGVPCALLIGERKASTDRKTSLNAVLREFSLEV